MTSKPPNSCCIMGGAQTWPQAGVPRMRLGTTVRLRLRPGAMRVMVSPTTIAFTITRSWIQKWLRFSVNLLISVIKVWEIRKFQASTPWLMVLQGIQRPYEDQPASFQGWGHKRCHHIPSWCWDITVYHQTGCWDCTHLPYAIHSLQDYLGELVRSLGTDITLDDVLTILDEHYNNVKALDALSQELFQLHMGEKEIVSDWGVLLSRHLQVLMVSFPECFPLDHVAELKHDHFYSGLPKQLKAMVAYLKTSTNKKIYSNYLQAVR